MPRIELSLQKCMEVIRYKKANPKSRTREIADHFGCGRTQIQAILKQTTEILKEYEENAREDKKRKRAVDYVDVNEALYKWYCLGRDRNIPIFRYHAPRRSTHHSWETGSPRI